MNIIFALTLIIKMASKIIKRTGEIVDFDQNKITVAIHKALVQSGETNIIDAKLISDMAVRNLANMARVEDIQDEVEKSIMKYGLYKTAKLYILYRAERSKVRPKIVSKDITSLVSESSKYFDNDCMREFIFFRTYAKWIPSKERREVWSETVDRYMSFMHNKLGNALSNDEYDEVRTAILKQEVMPSMRLLQFAGPAATRCNVCVYNCAFTAPECFKDLVDIMYVSMCGTGVGFSVESIHVDRFPIIQKQKSILHHFEIDDSKEGWCDAFDFALNTWYGGEDVVFDYSKLRPAGARLKTMGGRSSGPQPLIDLMEFTRALILKRQGHKLSPLNMYDIICKIGQIVVSGGVRRCIAAGSRVLTKDNSYKQIEDVKVGDNVLTDNGWKPVTNFFDQGLRSVLRINHQEGYIECTSNHRIAVFNDIDGTYIWKEAKDLVENDVLGFPIKDAQQESVVVNTGINQMPTFNYVKPAHSTTCKNIIIPPLDEKMAWLIGQIQGDGYVYLTSKAGEVNVAVHGDELHQAQAVEEQLKRFGVNVHYTMPKPKDHSYKVRTKSKQLATYIYEHVKQPKITLRVPEFIKRATPRIKAAFVQGLMDADGSILTRPVLVVTTIYEDFAKDIQALLMSMGIVTRFKFRPVKEENWHDKHEIALINNRDKRLFLELTEGIGYKKCKIQEKVQNANGWPHSTLNFEKPQNWTLKVSAQQKGVPSDTLKDIFKIESRFIPIKVKSITHDLKFIKTYDIEVKDNHNFVCSGVLVHNSAMISLSDLKDSEIRGAKDGAFWNTNPQRSMANNSAVYNEKPSMIEFMREWLSLAESGTGERGIFNRGDLYKVIPQRRVEVLGDDINHVGLNPCAEIILKPRQFCNLSEIVCRSDDNLVSLMRKARVATIIGTYQSSLTNYQYIDPKWKENQEQERLLGVSITGQWDCPAVRSEYALRELRSYCININREYADRFGINCSTAITAIKPSGTVSQMTNSASGIHPRFSKYYIRRIRISATDPLLKLMKDQGYPCSPEVGQIEATANTYVLEFPVKSPDNAICVDDVTAIEQLEYWKRVKINFTEHNPSATIYVKPDEWIEVAKWVWTNWEFITGLSFFPYTEDVYQLAPYDEITPEEYEQACNKLTKVDFSKLVYYELHDNTDVKKEVACAGGICDR